MKWIKRFFFNALREWCLALLENIRDILKDRARDLTVSKETREACSELAAAYDKVIAHLSRPFND